MDLPAPVGEAQALAELRAIAQQNRVLKSFIGQGYHGTHTPGVILRNILENPAWYTAYTPYQAEISQGRMEALVNFQTMVCDLTGMDYRQRQHAGRSHRRRRGHDAGQAQREGQGHGAGGVGRHPSANPGSAADPRRAAGADDACVAMSGDEWQAALARDDYFAALPQYPASSGWLADWQADADATVHGKQAAFIMATDLLALTLLKTPGEMGADIVIGNSQRFGVPMGAGGPTPPSWPAATSSSARLPGRLVGVSVDSHGNPAYRLALQTREQHIRREKATSNICTAQVLLAVMASMYAVYHGPQGLTRIAERVARYTAILAAGLAQLGYTHQHHSAFDTLCYKTGDATEPASPPARWQLGANLRTAWGEWLCVSLDETTTRDDIRLLWRIFAEGSDKPGQALPDLDALADTAPSLIPAGLRRSSAFLTPPGLQHPPLGNRDAALPAQPGRQGPGAGPHA